MAEEWGAILVVDDDLEMRELVHDVLKDRGHQITTAGSGQEASRCWLMEVVDAPADEGHGGGLSC
jgi:CheY-like chemotaxis protein